MFWLYWRVQALARLARCYQKRLVSIFTSTAIAAIIDGSRRSLIVSSTGSLAAGSCHPAAAGCRTTR